MNWRPGQNLTIKTDRLVLKTMQPGDITPDYLGWWNDNELQKGLGHRARGWDRARAEKHVASFDCIKGYHFGIYLKKNGKLIGFYTLNREPVQKISSSTTLIGDKTCWRKGRRRGTVRRPRPGCLWIWPARPGRSGWAGGPSRRRRKRLWPVTLPLS